MAAGELKPPNPEDPLVGTVISERYRVLKKLGEGGMGAVYLAEHVFIEKKVALKVLAPELARKPDLTARFLQEAKSASRIGHENVIDISDFGQSPEGLVFFAMEFLPGKDLGDVLRQSGAMPWGRAKPILLQIAKALRAAHERGIIHRDMKPENVFLINKDGNPDFVKLLDFGIAKVQGLGGEDTPKLTQTGMIFGTPEYMAPEQAEGKVCDHRADLYAVGCVMYHMITGEPPFKADSFMAMLTKHLLEEPVKPSVRRPDLGIPPALDRIVMKALLKDREQRFPDMNAFIAAIEAVPVTVAQGPEAALGAATASAAPLGRGAETRQLGGGDAMAVIATSARVSHTAMVTAAGVDPAALDDVPLARVQAERRRGNTGLLVLGGLSVGVAVAIGLVLMRGSESAPVPVPPAPSQPVHEAAHPATTTAPLPSKVTSAAMDEHQPGGQAGSEGTPEQEAHGGTQPAGESASARGGRLSDRGVKRSSSSRAFRRIELHDDDKPARRPLSVPAELKGFPGE